MSEPSTQNFWERLNNLVLVRFLLLFASGWALVQCFAYFEAIIIIFSLAAVVAFLLSFPVNWLKRFLPHGMAVSLVFLLSLLVFGWFTVTVGLAIISQGQQLLDTLPDFVNSFTPLVQQLENYLRSRHLQVDFSAVPRSLRDQLPSFINASFTTSQILLDYFVKLILIEVVAFFMLLDGEQLWSFVLRLIPQHSQGKFTFIVKRNFLGFFQGQLLLSLFFTIVAFIVFLILQVPLALILAVIVGLFQLIPGIGATLGIGLVCLILLPKNAALAFNVLIVCIIIQQIKDNLLAPRIMQNSLNINPVIGFFALLIGYRIAGLLGIFLATPIAGVVLSWFGMESKKMINWD
jgi:predicted PurR-regulated permease PerM